MKNLLALITLCSVLIGCAHRTLTVPSPGAVQGGISNVKASATTAEQQRQQIEQLNREARAKQARIDNKDIFIEGYKKWKASHPSQP